MATKKEIDAVIDILKSDTILKWNLNLSNKHIGKIIDAVYEISDTIIKTEKIILDTQRIAYKLPSGKFVNIGSQDKDFFFKLQNLPAPTKINMMQLNVEEMLECIQDKRFKKKYRLNEILNKKWIYHETGDIVDKKTFILDDFDLSISQLKKQLKSDKISYELLSDLMDYLTDIYKSHLIFE